MEKDCQKKEEQEGEKSGKKKKCILMSELK